MSNQYYAEYVELDQIHIVLIVLILSIHVTLPSSILQLFSQTKPLCSIRTLEIRHHPLKKREKMRAINF